MRRKENAMQRTSTRLLAKRGKWTINYVSATNTEETKFLRCVHAMQRKRNATDINTLACKAG